MNDSDKQKNMINKLGGWERLVIFCGVIMTVPIFALLATAFFALSHEREGAFMGIVLSIICLLVLWALVWGALWIITGFRAGGLIPGNSESDIETLKQENERLRKLLDQQSRHTSDSG